MNYDKEMDKILDNCDRKPRILLHSCCAPCSSTCIDRLSDKANLDIMYYNPNIEPEEEYLKRKEEQKKLIKLLNNDIKVLDCDYDNDKYHEVVKGYEKEPEKGSRCYICYKQRMEYTAKYAKDNGYDMFATTLTVSPYKVTKWINEIGFDLEKKYNIKYLPTDFKKQNGYKKSIELSKKYNLYRQDYCGCIYSKKEKDSLFK